FQKCTHLRLSAPDRYIQCFGCEDDAGAGLAEAQIVGEHYLIIVNILRLRTTQLDRQQGDAPPGQPAGESMHYHPVGEIGKRTLRLPRRLVEHNLGKTAAAYQASAEILQHQAKKIDYMDKRLAHGRLADACSAQKGETANPQRSRVHAEELVSMCGGQSYPDGTVVVHRYPLVRLMQRQLRKPQLCQQRLGALAGTGKPEQGFLQQANGDGVFAHGSDNPASRVAGASNLSDQKRGSVALSIIACYPAQCGKEQAVMVAGRQSPGSGSEDLPQDDGLVAVGTGGDDVDGGAHQLLDPLDVGLR